MGGKDFAFSTDRVPGCFVALGVGNERLGAVHGLQHPKFTVDEGALPLGAALHVAFALASLAEL
jgi:IAA-amino acid hydrolase